MYIYTYVCIYTYISKCNLFILHLYSYQHYYCSSVFYFQTVCYILTTFCIAGKDFIALVGFM